MSPTDQNPTTDAQHLVVALKYRPQKFETLIGQDHIANALSKAIEQNKVGHAYLFTGARGVGKTSSARIFAKCLNCKTGPTKQPCDTCDICDAISQGEDVDVLEIDGASNRGIDEIRTLRSNASVRPSRSRYKIYIIDEVHMLTTPAFNALLKTLEEPPPHVKFIFCTTDPQKIPITVLSRCQRFDFSPVQTGEIAQSLKVIAETEGVDVDSQALALLARRANGSMRDSQSLLEQLLSFCDKTITVDDVHQLLGTADVGRIAELAAAIVAHDATATLNLINQAINEGVNAGQLANQLLGYFRDAMAVRVGCGEDTLLACTAAELPALSQVAENLGLETILSILQVLDGALVKMQFSLHARTLLEVAAIRICNLENLDSISDLVKQLSESGAGSGAVRSPAVTKVPQKKVELRKVASTTDSKKNEIADKKSFATSNPGIARPPEASAVKPISVGSQSVASSAAAVLPADPKSSSVAIADVEPKRKRISSASPVSEADVESMWSRMIGELGDMTADMAANYESLNLKHADNLVVTLKDAYHTKECNKPDRKQKIESSLAEIAGRRLRVDFVTSKKVQSAAAPAAPQLSHVQQIRKLQEHEFIKQALSVFDAEIVNFYETKSDRRG